MSAFPLACIIQFCDDATQARLGLIGVRFYTICHHLWVNRPLRMNQLKKRQECTFNGILHSYSDKPAIIHADGTQEW